MHLFAFLTVATLFAWRKPVSGLSYPWSLLARQGYRSYGDIFPGAGSMFRISMPENAARFPGSQHQPMLGGVNMQAGGVAAHGMHTGGGVAHGMQTGGGTAHGMQKLGDGTNGAFNMQIRGGSPDIQTGDNHGTQGAKMKEGGAYDPSKDLVFRSAEEDSQESQGKGVVHPAQGTVVGLAGAHGGKMNSTGAAKELILITQEGDHAAASILGAPSIEKMSAAGAHGALGEEEGGVVIHAGKIREFVGDNASKVQGTQMAGGDIIADKSMNFGGDDGGAKKQTELGGVFGVQGVPIGGGSLGKLKAGDSVFGAQGVPMGGGIAYGDQNTGIERVQATGDQARQMDVVGDHGKQVTNMGSVQAKEASGIKEAEAAASGRINGTMRVGYTRGVRDVTMVGDNVIGGVGVTLGVENVSGGLGVITGGSESPRELEVSMGKRDTIGGLGVTLGVDNAPGVLGVTIGKGESRGGLGMSMEGGDAIEGMGLTLRGGNADGGLDVSLGGEEVPRGLVVTMGVGGDGIGDAHVTLRDGNSPGGLDLTIAGGGTYAGKSEMVGKDDAFRGLGVTVRSGSVHGELDGMLRAGNSPDRQNLPVVRGGLGGGNAPGGHNLHAVGSGVQGGLGTMLGRGNAPGGQGLHAIGGGIQGGLNVMLGRGNAPGGQGLHRVGGGFQGGLGMILGGGNAPGRPSLHAVGGGVQGGLGMMLERGNAPVWPNGPMGGGYHRWVNVPTGGGGMGGYRGAMLGGSNAPAELNGTKGGSGVHVGPGMMLGGSVPGGLNGPVGGVGIHGGQGMLVQGSHFPGALGGNVHGGLGPTMGGGYVPRGIGMLGGSNVAAQQGVPAEGGGVHRELGVAYVPLGQNTGAGGHVLTGMQNGRNEGKGVLSIIEEGVTQGALDMKKGETDTKRLIGGGLHSRLASVVKGTRKAVHKLLRKNGAHGTLGQQTNGGVSVSIQLGGGAVEGRDLQGTTPDDELALSTKVVTTEAHSEKAL